MLGAMRKRDGQRERFQRKKKNLRLGVKDDLWEKNKRVSFGSKEGKGHDEAGEEQGLHADFGLAGAGAFGKCSPKTTRASKEKLCERTEQRRSADGDTKV